MRNERVHIFRASNMTSLLLKCQDCQVYIPLGIAYGFCMTSEVAQSAQPSIIGLMAFALGEIVIGGLSRNFMSDVQINPINL